ncbi:MAG TPA: hypothetical protein VFS43_00160 [Polyangiaceae bacterium]|nr:hypothetical protein [Polyangiaceae bacterium]
MRKTIGALGLVAGLVACAERGSDAPGAAGGEGGDGAAAAQGSAGFAGAAGQPEAGSPGAGGAGAGGAPARPRLVHSGSRLRAVVYRGADGSQHPTGRWFDTTRGEECTYQPAADGAVRCLPTNAVAHAGLYADAGCSTPAVALPSLACDAANFAYIEVAAPGACSAGKRVFRKGPQVTPAPPLGIVPVYQGTPGACQYVEGAGPNVFAVGAEVPAAEFLGATVERLEP